MNNKKLLKKDFLVSITLLLFFLLLIPISFTMFSTGVIAQEENIRCGDAHQVWFTFDTPSWDLWGKLSYCDGANSCIIPKNGPIRPAAASSGRNVEWGCGYLDSSNNCVPVHRCNARIKADVPDNNRERCKWINANQPEWRNWCMISCGNLHYPVCGPLHGTYLSRDLDDWPTDKFKDSSYEETYRKHGVNRTALAKMFCNWGDPKQADFDHEKDKATDKKKPLTSYLDSDRVIRSNIPFPTNKSFVHWTCVLMLRQARVYPHPLVQNCWARVCPQPEVDCSMVDSDLDWLNSCPRGEQCRDNVFDIPISNSPKGCPNSQKKTCYTVNKPPSVNISITTDGSKIFGYSSNTHTGRELNNPQTILNAKYTDIDGSDDIRRMYVWWQDNNNTPRVFKDTGNNSEKITPSGSFGFMIAKKNDNSWGDVYVPHIKGNTRQWVRAGKYGDSTISIVGSNNNIVQLKNWEIKESGNTVELSVNMNFPLSGQEIVNTSKYRIWGMADDKYALDYRDDIEWRGAANWVLDMTNPRVSNIKIIPQTNERLRIKFSINDAGDNLGLAYVRLDACRFQPTKTKNIGSYPLELCPMGSIDFTKEDSLLKQVGIKSKLPVNTNKRDIDVILDLTGNEGGFVTFRAMTIDYGGNYHFSEDYIFNLDNWVVTKDGLVFGKQGTRSYGRELESDIWSSISLGSLGFNAKEGDLSEQALLTKRDEVISSLESLIRVNIHNSFKIARYYGLEKMLGLPYYDLVGAYQMRRLRTPHDFEEVKFSSGAKRLSDLCVENKEFCIVRSSSSINIPKGFECDGKGMILVEGDVNINPDFTNLGNNDACIILSKGDINIEKGEKITESSGPGYNIIEAFLISEGTINILEDGNGLFVEGGLIAFNHETGNWGSVNNKRKVDMSIRNLFPVLAVDNNSKYGLLGRELFGSQVQVFKLELGFKPF